MGCSREWEPRRDGEEAVDNPEGDHQEEEEGSTALPAFVSRRCRSSFVFVFVGSSVDLGRET